MAGGLVARPTGANFTRDILKKIYAADGMNDGSLFLWDPRHPLGEISGVPANLAVVPNVARETADALLSVGDPDDATLQGTWYNYRSNNPAAPVNTGTAIERTTKGGIHIAKSKTNDTLNSYALMRPPTAVKTYLDAQVPGHLIYASVWARRTRAITLSGSGLEAPTFSWLQNSGNRMMDDSGVSAAGVNTGGGTGAGGYHTSPGKEALEPYFMAGASAQFNSSDSVQPIYIGATPPDAFQSFNTNKNQSFILYRVHICDLTVAGMTFAEMRDQDLALYNAAVVDEDGDFYGDSFTAPETLCP